MSLRPDHIGAPQNPKPNVGELGEQLVAEWLETQSWAILHYRWRCRWGEIDLIAQQQEREIPAEGEQKKSLPNLETNRKVYPSPSSSPLLAFVEVKTRSSGNWDADGRLAITPQKQAKLWHTAQLFLAEHPNLANLPCRFDVALVSYRRVSQRSHPVNPTPASEQPANSPSLPTTIDSGIRVPPLQLGQPLFRSGYRLVLQDYIPSAFDGLG
ncbi:YraN family protein [Allocoleopsis sp.]|uniref:YraN family protein n=1 Tax=Allocoleopsis sp. TaxID=3088169 RepID=UPI002FD21803